MQPDADTRASRDPLIEEADGYLRAAIAQLEALESWRVNVCPVFDWLVSLREMRQEMAPYFDGSSDA